MEKKTMALIGAGNRGIYAYAAYALRHPNELQFTAVAEPDDTRRALFQKLHNIEDKNCFSSWEELLAAPQLADAVLIATQDKMHTEPAIRALHMGYDVLLEKPMATTPEECVSIEQAVVETGRILSVCHVLRYTKFFSAIKKLLDEHVIGTLVNIEHSENVAYWHYVHSFVRGPWRNAEEASPVILAKCCHDMDLLRWLADGQCQSVVSCGGLAHFKAECAPDGAALRCLDGCPMGSTCPYNAAKLYFTPNPNAALAPLIRMISSDESENGKLAALRTGPYGRCVYHCDNNVADHQLAELTFDNGVVASFTLSAFTNDNVRRIRLMGTDGEIKGVMEENRVEYYKFSTGETVSIVLPQSDFGHSGGDDELMRNFVQMLNGTAKNRTSAKLSLESHLISFAAEQSRLTGKIVNFNDYISALC